MQRNGLNRGSAQLLVLSFFHGHGNNRCSQGAVIKKQSESISASPPLPSAHSLAREGQAVAVCVSLKGNCGEAGEKLPCNT